MVKRTLSSGGFEAEFFADSSPDTTVVHYIITRKGSADILAWGQESTLADAEKAARDAMQDLYQQSLGRSAAG